MNNQLETIKQRILTELACPLKEEARNLVFGKGNPEADIMFIGEAPGEQEDIQGKPFVGRAGKELDKLLHVIGLGIDDVYIANILKYRPPKNRDPLPEEIARHTPFLVEQIKAIAPKAIVTLGNFSTKFVLAGFSVGGMKKIPGVSALHGKPRTIRTGDQQWTVVPMYHPAAMLYKPPLRAVIEQDFKELGAFLGTSGKKGQKITDYF